MIFNFIFLVNTFLLMKSNKIKGLKITSQHLDSRMIIINSQHANAVI